MAQEKVQWYSSKKKNYMIKLNSTIMIPISIYKKCMDVECKIRTCLQRGRSFVSLPISCNLCMLQQYQTSEKIQWHITNILSKIDLIWKKLKMNWRRKWMWGLYDSITKVTKAETIKQSHSTKQSLGAVLRGGTVKYAYSELDSLECDTVFDLTLYRKLP